MKSFGLGSISRNLYLLVILAILPALAILLYSGIEQRQRSIENAQRDVLVLAHTMAVIQQDITNSVRQMLATLALMPEVQRLDQKSCGEIFREVLEQNPTYLNFSLTDIRGDVMASGRPFAATNLGDRKHVRSVLEKKEFSIGEYIISRIGTSAPAFAFAYPVFDKDKRLKAVLTTTIKLTRFSALHDISKLPEKSFVAVTDHKGIRLYYYPPKEETNPVGKPINAEAWERAGKALGPDIFIGQGSDGIRRIMAFEQVRFKPDDAPYLYVWTGIPEAQVLSAANAALTRNLLLLLIAAALSFFISWLIGEMIFIAPIRRLIALTQKMAGGDLGARSEGPVRSDEFGVLTRAFHDMADALGNSQKKALENEARFRLLMDSLDALVYVADMDTYEVLFINEYGKRTLGDVTGRACWQSIQKGQGGPCSFCTNRYLLDKDGNPGKVYAWEFQNTVTGQFFYMQDRAIHWTDGRIVRLQVAMDVSDRKEAETRLAEEKERLAVTLRSIGDGVITVDCSGNIVLLNKVAEHLTGWTNDEAAGRPLEEIFRIINEQTKEKSENHAKKVISSGRISGLARQTTLIARDGRQRSIADSSAPILDAGGNIIGVVLVFRDITDQIKTEKELLKVKKLESIGVLAGGIAHDFNNILTAILGNINLALLDETLKEKTRERLSDAEKASLRVRDLIQQLMTFSKGGDPVTETSSLENVIKESANFVLHGDRVACRYNIPEDLWLVDIDKGQISRVVQNLVINASHAMPEGGIIEITCENMTSADKTALPHDREGKFIKISIRDSGIGIPEKIIDKIFDPYFSTKREGSGLGLAICQSIIRKHNGDIFAESSPGEGTTFSIYLPVSEMTATLQQAITGEHKPSVRNRVLVMDDEDMVRSVAREMLVQLGHEAVLSSDGEEAVRLYRESMNSDCPIDLVVLDLTIPGGMGGREAAKKILELDPRARVIVSSGYSNDRVLANFMDYGFCAAIIKPYKIQDMSRVISQALTDSAH